MGPRVRFRLIVAKRRIFTRLMRHLIIIKLFRIHGFIRRSRLRRLQHNLLRRQNSTSFFLNLRLTTLRPKSNNVRTRYTVNRIRTIIRRRFISNQHITRMLLLRLRHVTMRHLIALRNILIQMTLTRMLTRPVLLSRLVRLLLRNNKVDLRMFGHNRKTAARIAGSHRYDRFEQSSHSDQATTRDP